MSDVTSDKRRVFVINKRNREIIPKDLLRFINATIIKIKLHIKCLY